MSAPKRDTMRLIAQAEKVMGAYAQVVQAGRSAGVRARASARLDVEFEAWEKLKAEIEPEAYAS